MLARFSLSSSSSCLILGLSTGISGSRDRDAAGFGVPNRLPNPPGADLRPKMLEPVDGPDVERPNFCGAGVVVGVVDSVLKMPLGFSSTFAGVATSISSSLLSILGTGFDASPRASPKPLPNSPPPPPGWGCSLSLAVLGSALKVVPRTKGDEPKADPL